MKRIRVADLAERDLDGIWLFTAKKSGRIERLRGFPVAKYIVYYHATSKHVVISRVLHGMRDQTAAYLDD